MYTLQPLYKPFNSFKSLLFLFVLSFPLQAKPCLFLQEEKGGSAESLFKTLQLFLEGRYEDYLELVYLQPKENRLEWKQFQEIQKEGREIFQKWERQKESYRKMVQTIWTSSSKASFDDLSKGGKIAFLISLLEISSSMRIKETFTELKKTGVFEKDVPLFEQAFFLYICALAKEGGKKKDPLQRLFTKDVYVHVQKVKQACLSLKEVGEKKAFSFYMKSLAHILDLDLFSPVSKLLLKEAIDREIYTKKGVESLKDFFFSLPSKEFFLMAKGREEKFLLD